MLRIVDGAMQGIQKPGEPLGNIQRLFLGSFEYVVISLTLSRHRGVAAGGGIKHHLDHAFNVPIHRSFRMRLGEILTVPHARGDELGIPPSAACSCLFPAPEGMKAVLLIDLLYLTHPAKHAFRLAL